MARKKKKEEESKRGDSAAVLSAALNTILLAFFICLTSMATITTEKVMKGLYSIRTSFGVAGGGVSPIETMGPLDELYLKGINHEAIMQLKHFVESHPFSNQIRLGVTKRGLVIELSSDLLFAPGSASLNARIYPILDRVASLIKSCKNKVIIEGYTDSTPVRTGPYSSNWELSTARAISVLKFFVNQEGIPANRFIAAGYGPTKPIFPNDTPEHRAKNRRVWILLKGTPQPLKKTNNEEVNIKGFFFKVKEFLR